MNTKTHVDRFVNFVSHEEVWQNCRVGDVASSRTLHRPAQRVGRAGTAPFGFSIDINNRRTKRNIGTFQLAHTRRVKRHSRRIFRVRCGASVSNAHGAGAFFIQGKTASENAGRGSYCGQRGQLNSAGKKCGFHNSGISFIV